MDPLDIDLVSRLQDCSIGLAVALARVANGKASGHVRGRDPLRRALERTALPVATAAAGTGSPVDAVWIALGEAAPRRRLVELAELATVPG